jgi:hypothetical protein
MGGPKRAVWYSCFSALMTVALAPVTFFSVVVQVIWYAAPVRLSICAYSTVFSTALNTRNLAATGAVRLSWSELTTIYCWVWRLRVHEVFIAYIYRLLDATYACPYMLFQSLINFFFSFRTSVVSLVIVGESLAHRIFVATFMSNMHN